MGVFRSAVDLSSILLSFVSAWSLVLLFFDLKEEIDWFVSTGPDEWKDEKLSLELDYKIFFPPLVIWLKQPACGKH